MSAFEKIKSLCGGDRADTGNSKFNSKNSFKKKLKVKKLKLAKKRRIKLKKLAEKRQDFLLKERERENRENISKANKANKEINSNKNPNFYKSIKRAQKIAEQNLEIKKNLFKVQERLSAFGNEGYMRNDLI